MQLTLKTIIMKKMLLCLANRKTDQRKERKRGPRENAAITKGICVSFSMWIIHIISIV